MLKAIFITTHGSTGVHTHTNDFATLKGAERAIKEFNGMKFPGMTFLAKRLYDLEEEKERAQTERVAYELKGWMPGGPDNAK